MLVRDIVWDAHAVSVPASVVRLMVAQEFEHTLHDPFIVQPIKDKRPACLMDRLRTTFKPKIRADLAAYRCVECEGSVVV